MQDINLNLSDDSIDFIDNNSHLCLTHIVMINADRPNDFLFDSKKNLSKTFPKLRFKTNDLDFYFPVLYLKDDMVKIIAMYTAKLLKWNKELLHLISNHNIYEAIKLIKDKYKIG